MSVELGNPRESPNITLGRRRRSWALLLVAALFLITWASLLHPDPITLNRNPEAALLVALFGAVGAAAAAYLSFLGVVADGRRTDLLVGLGFSILAGTKAILAAGELTADSGTHSHAEGLLVALSWTVASSMFAAAAASSAKIPASRRGATLAVSLGCVFLADLLLGTWTLNNAAQASGHLLASAGFMVAAVLCFLTAGALWRRGRVVSAFPGLEYLMCAAGFLNVEYAIHPPAPPATSEGDIVGLAVYAAATLAFAASVALTYVRAGRYAFELSAVRALSASTPEADVASLSKYIARVVGDLIDAQVRMLTFETAEGEEDVLDAPGPPSQLSSRVVVTVDRRLNGQVSVGVPLGTHGRRLGTLVATRESGSGFTEPEVELLEVCAVQAGMLLERSVLREEVAAAAVVGERSRLAREVHDGLAQHLAFLKMRVAWLRRSPSALDVGQLEDVEAVLETALSEARQAITTLRAEPQGSSTADAIAGFAAEFGQVSGLSVQVVHDASVPEVGPKARVELLRIVQEALNNARKHAGASHLSVLVRARGRGVEVSIEDDGAGFDPTDKRAGHFGIEIMRERAESIGGHFELTSSPDAGTRIRVWAPALEAPGDSDRRVG